MSRANTNPEDKNLQITRTAMYHMFKTDMFGNRVPLMSISDKRVADEYLERNRHIVTQVVDVPRSVRTLALM